MIVIGCVILIMVLLLTAHAPSLDLWCAFGAGLFLGFLNLIEDRIIKRSNQKIDEQTKVLK